LFQSIKQNIRTLLDGPSEGSDPEAGEKVSVSREQIEALVGNAVDRLALYERALSHRSVLREEEGRYAKSNERLEFLGDAVLGMLVAKYLYEQFPDRDEGFLTQMRSKLVNNKRALARFARAIDLGDHVIMSSNMDQSGGRQNASILADAFEAVIGALYLDRGLDATRAFVEEAIFAEMDVGAIAQKRYNYKSALQEYVQARGWSHPEYRLVSEEGPSHEKLFTAEVIIKDESYGRGTGRSKKKAEQEAAANAITHLEQEEEIEAML
jgi:ribonuclease-3